MQVTATIHVARAIAGFVRQHGRDPAPLLRSCGIDARLLDDPDARIPHATILALFEAGAGALDDPLFGLRLGASLPQGSLHLAEYAIRSGGTLRESLARLMRLQRLIYDGAPHVLEERDDEAALLHRPPPGYVPPPIVLDYAISNIARIARQLTEGRFTPRRIELARPAPPSDTAYREVFRAPVRFGAPVSAIRMDRAELDLRIAPGDPTLHAMLDRFAEERLARLPASGDLIDDLRVAIRRALDGAGRPQAAELAQRLGLSERTLSRRLRERGSSYAALLDEVSRERASELLAGGTNTSEVAFLLGFSELSAFHRAFRRWTGTTPGDWRRQQAHAPHPSRGSS